LGIGINRHDQEHVKEEYLLTNQETPKAKILKGQMKFYIFYPPLQTRLSDRSQSAQGSDLGGADYFRAGLVLLLFSFSVPD
jgi:hypothetical protein